MRLSLRFWSLRGLVDTSDVVIEIPGAFQLTSEPRQPVTTRARINGGRIKRTSVMMVWVQHRLRVLVCTRKRMIPESFPKYEVPIA